MITCYYLKRVDILGESAKVHLYPRGREGGWVGGWNPAHISVLISVLLRSSFDPFFLQYDDTISGNHLYAHHPCRNLKL